NNVVVKSFHSINYSYVTPYSKAVSLIVSPTTTVYTAESDLLIVLLSFDFTVAFGLSIFSFVFDIFCPGYISVELNLFHPISSSTDVPCFCEIPHSVSRFTTSCASADTVNADAPDKAIVVVVIAVTTLFIKLSSYLFYITSLYNSK